MLEQNFNYIKELFGDDAQTVFRVQENKHNRVYINDGNITGNSSSCGRGLNARVCKKVVYGFASLPEVSKESAISVLKQATDNANVMAQHAPRNITFAKSGNGMILPEIVARDIDNKKILEVCKEIDSYILQKYPNLKSRMVGGVQESQEKHIYTSDANNGGVIYPRAFVHIGLVAEDEDGAPVELYESFGGIGGFDDYFKSTEWLREKIDKLYEQLMDKKEGVYAEAGYKTVVLGNLMTGMLAHEAVGHTVEADLVMSGSVAGKYMDKQVASEKVTMVDFANTVLGEATPIPVYIDDEGVEAKDVTLIENGVLRGYMHNRETAGGYGVEPAGNARGWGFSDEPLIRMRNTAVLPGSDKFEDIIASVEDGYYLINSTNGQADLTGEFMFGVGMGYEIKNGKLGRAIKDTTVSGVAFDMLKTVDMVSDQMEWFGLGYCGKKQPMTVGMGGPALRCKIMIGGR